MRTTDLGELGVIGSILRPVVFDVLRDGAAWDLTGYITPTLTVVDVRTRTAVTPGGTLAITTPATGEVTYTPSVADPIAATAGTYEARVKAIPAGGGDPEPSQLFRYTIAG